MSKLKFPTDRKINSTDNNGYAEGFRDENLLQKDLLDTEIPEDDLLPEEMHETGEKNRDIYNEEGYTHDPGR